MTEQQNIDSQKQNSFLLVVLVIIFVMAVGAGGYFGFRFVMGEINAVRIKVAEYSSENRHLQAQYERLNEAVQEAQSTIQRTSITQAKGWKPVIIEHLVQLANLTLNTTGDIKLALSYLQVAKQYVQGQEFSAVSYALNKNIASLQAIPVVDSSEVILEIEMLIQKIDSLAMVNENFVGSQERSTIKYSGATKNLWKELFNSSTKALKDIVVIRRQAVEPLLSLEQERVLRLNVETKLLQAELAVINRQGELYHSCLESADKLLAKYFGAGNLERANISSILKGLQEIELQPTVSSLKESIAAVQNFMGIDTIRQKQEIAVDDLQPAPSTEGTTSL